MQTKIATILLAMILGVTTLTLTACGDSDDGPAEQAGQGIDNAAGNASDAAGDAADTVGDKADQAGDQAQDTMNGDDDSDY